MTSVSQVASLDSGYDLPWASRARVRDAGSEIGPGRQSARADACLAPRGWLIVEFGLGQEEAVRALVSTQSSLAVVKIRSDLVGIARTAVVQRN